MNTNSDPTTWTANRAGVGWGILGTVWSSVFFGVTVVLTDEDLILVFLLLGCFSGLVGLGSWTAVGIRLVNGPGVPAPATPSAPAGAPRSASVPAKSSPEPAQLVRHGQRPQAGSAMPDGKVIALMVLGLVLTVAIFVAMVTVLSS